MRRIIDTKSLLDLNKNKSGQKLGTTIELEIDPARTIHVYNPNDMNYGFNVTSTSSVKDYNPKAIYKDMNGSFILVRIDSNLNPCKPNCLRLVDVVAKQQIQSPNAANLYIDREDFTKITNDVVKTKFVAFYKANRASLPLFKELDSDGGKRRRRRTKTHRKHMRKSMRKMRHSY